MIAFRFYRWLAHRTKGHDPRDPDCNAAPDGWRYHVWAFAMHGMVRVSNRRYARKMRRRIECLVLAQDARNLTR